MIALALTVAVVTAILALRHAAFRIRLARCWSGIPVRDGRMVEIHVRRSLIRIWLKPFSRPYYFSKYGPHCFGAAWIGCMVFGPAHPLGLGFHEAPTWGRS